MEIKTIYKHYTTINEMLSAEDFLMSKNENAKTKIINRYNKAIRTIKKHLISISKCGNKTKLNIYCLNHRFLKTLWHFNKKYACISKLKEVYNY